MDKKLLIGISICSVILLVIGSLSNVFGVQSITSGSLNQSPLFRIRTQKAIYKKFTNYTVNRLS